jgi:hypothetical protein
MEKRVLVRPTNPEKGGLVDPHISVPVHRHSLIKSNNLLSDCVLPFWMKNNIMIRSWLRKNNDCESSRSVPVRRSMKTVTTSKKLLKRRDIRRGRLNRRRRWSIR